MELARRATQVKESSTLAIAAKAKALIGRGLPVISFSAGEPDFGTPAHVNEAAARAISDGFTKYTPSSGILELRQAICAKLLSDNGLSYGPEQIVVSNGAKQSLFNAFTAILEAGDEVLVPAPYWISYVEIIALCGGVPVVVRAEEGNGLKVTVAQLEKVATPRTKAIIINSPCNPTGVVYGRAELEELAAFAAKRDLFVISDEIYEKLIFDDGLAHVSVASFGEDMLRRTIVVNGLSKSHAMTGWRIGYTACAGDVAKVIGNVQSHTTSNINSIAQKAALAALTGEQACVERMRLEFKRRRDYICKRLASLPGVYAVRPSGAFYVFVNVSALCCGRLGGRAVENGEDLAGVLLDECNVAIVPGVDFGYDKHVRFSYSTSMEAIKEGMDRIETFLTK